MFYSSGACPMCGPTMPLAFLKSTKSNKVVVFCHSCECVWEDPIEAENNSSPVVMALERAAPEGVFVATKEEIEMAGVADQIQSEYLEWDSLLTHKLIKHR